MCYSTLCEGGLLLDDGSEWLDGDFADADGLFGVGYCFLGVLEGGR